MKRRDKGQQIAEKWLEENPVLSEEDVEERKEQEEREAKVERRRRYQALIRGEG